jgi:hypothetical protein
MHANIKMLVATQRSKTNANKVHAFSMLIRDNIVANSMSLNAFLDNFLKILCCFYVSYFISFLKNII